MNSINNFLIEDAFVIKINLNNFNLILNESLNKTFDDVIIMNKKEYSKLLLEKSGIIINKNKIKDINKCSICFDDIKINHKTYLINNCNHFYHYKCIKKWFELNSACPICRVSSETCIEI